MIGYQVRRQAQIYTLTRLLPTRGTLSSEVVVVFVVAVIVVVVIVVVVVVFIDPPFANKWNIVLWGCCTLFLLLFLNTNQSSRNIGQKKVFSMKTKNAPKALKRKINLKFFETWAFPNWGRGRGGLPTWEFFPLNPVFF